MRALATNAATLAWSLATPDASAVPLATSTPDGAAAHTAARTLSGSRPPASSQPVRVIPAAGGACGVSAPATRLIGRERRALRTGAPGSQLQCVFARALTHTCTPCTPPRRHATCVWERARARRHGLPLRAPSSHLECVPVEGLPRARVDAVDEQVLELGRVCVGRHCGGNAAVFTHRRDEDEVERVLAARARREQVAERGARAVAVELRDRRARGGARGLTGAT